MIGDSMRNNVISIGRQQSPAAIRREWVRKDHEEAVRTFAVESYLLDEMSEDEQLHFEEHCLECAICAKALEAGRIFTGKIAPASQGPRDIPWIDRMFKIATNGPWLKPTAALAVLWLPVMGWQQATISDLNEPHANTVILARGAEKGVPDKGPYLLKTASATIEFYTQEELKFPYYRVRISGGQAKSFSQVVPAPVGDEAHRFSVQVLRNALGNGHFAVSIEGLDREDSKHGYKLDEVYGFDLK